jgi:RNA polymerase sigma-70 factor (ECF subfamily)
MTDKPDPEALQRLERALLKLPRLQREIFLAVRLDDMSYAELAERTGLTVRQVERQFAKSLRVLWVMADDYQRPWWRSW